MSQEFSRPRMMPLSQLCVVEVEGKDGISFLQGQLTNDTRLLTPIQSQLSGYCTPKGRLLALIRVVMLQEDRLLLILPQELAEAMVKRLSMFVMRARVRIARLDAIHPLGRVYGISGDGIESLFHARFPTLPPESEGVVTQPEAVLIRMPGAAARFLLVANEAVVQPLQQQCQMATETAWDQLEIEAGSPRITATTSEAFVPQMLNLQLIGGLSFNKGCYTGQEVVARMQYLGKLKRRMYRLHCDDPTPPLPGDSIDSPLSESGQGAGKVVVAAPSPSGVGSDLLAVLEIAVADGELTLPSRPEAKLTRLDLPYPFADG